MKKIILLVLLTHGMLHAYLGEGLGTLFQSFNTYFRQQENRPLLNRHSSTRNSTPQTDRQASVWKERLLRFLLFCPPIVTK